MTHIDDIAASEKPQTVMAERARFTRFSPLTRQRLRNFRRNRRAFISLILLCLVTVVTGAAELIANDKPLALRYKGEWYFPFAVSYPETTFGGFLEAETDYTDSFVQEMILEEGDGKFVWPPIRFKYDTINYNLTEEAPAPPDGVNYLGTDDQGRDVLSNLIYGVRVSLLFGITVTLLSSVAGIAFGALSGYRGGMTDLIGQRFIEIWNGIPELFVLIIICSIVQPNLWLLAGIITLFNWPRLTGVVRAEFLKARNMPYVTAAKTLGVGDMTLIFRHILPNAMVSALSYIPFVITGTISTLAALDFLGFGLPPEDPSLGRLLQQGKVNVQDPWIGLSVFAVMSFLLTLLLFVGEGVRDAFDPSKR